MAKKKRKGWREKNNDKECHKLNYLLNKFPAEFMLKNLNWELELKDK